MSSPVYQMHRVVVAQDTEVVRGDPAAGIDVVDVGREAVGLSALR